MIEWSEYLSNLLSSEADFDNLTISLDDGQLTTEIPPIVKASVSMLDKMIEHQGRLNLIVFPEKLQSVFIFTLMKLFHNISQGKIKGNYDPSEFEPGEKLKVGNTIVQYLGTETRGDKECMVIKLADTDRLSTPIEHMPIFQRVTTKRRIGTYKQFSEARKKALTSLGNFSDGEEKIAYVADMKTHMDSSIYMMTSVTGAKAQLAQCRIGGRKVTDIFYIAQVDYQGQISNISAGQMSGIPAIVFASDLYAISSAAEEGNPIQSIIIDGSNTNVLMGQLDALDELISLKVPIVCLTDVANSFDLDPIEARGFNIWRWDGDSITEQLYDAVPLASDQRTKNCAKHAVTFLKSEGLEIGEAMRGLSRHRHDIQEQSPAMMKMFDRLNGLTFSAIRSTVDFNDFDREVALRTIEDSENTLKAESMYLDDATRNDYCSVISNLQKVYSCGYVLKKGEMFKDFLKKNPKSTICLIIPEKGNKKQIQHYWSDWCEGHCASVHVRVLLPSEYYSMQAPDMNITVICGWLKRAIMRKIIYSFNTCQYIVLLYDYENKWRNYDFRKWNNALKNSGNKKIIEKSFSSDNIEISTERYDAKSVVEDEKESSDELAEIELILKKNKFKRYSGDGQTKENTVLAIPVSFVGGYLSFYRSGHKVISATKVITGESEKIEMKLPSELRVGDFVVIREADKDLVRELADLVLANSGKSNLRETASKWHEALEIELLFCTPEQLYERLKEAGCSRGFPTVKRWIEDDDVIAPQSKDDLKIIADVTGNELLSELLDEVFDAAQEVRNAHLLAGKKLSEQLKLNLASELQDFEEIDPFNFWEPIDVEIDRIGNVKVLKIIDIGSEIEVDAADTNRLIEE